jgi:PAS domain S-box-containing protein
MTTMRTDRAVPGDAQQQYQQLVASVDGIVWELDARTFRFLFVSQQAERLLGYPLEQWFTPGFWVDHLHPDDREWALELCLRATRDKQNHDFEYRMLTADGRVIWLRDIVTVVVEDGQAAKLRGVMVDITARKRAEAALRESEQRYREVFNCSSECIFLLDVTPEGRFKFAEFNPAEEQTVGYTTAAVAGRYVEDVVPAGLAAMVTANYRRCVAAGALISYDEELSLPTGRKSFHTNLVPVRDESGRVHRIIGVARDVTERRQAEEQLRASLREKEVLLKEVHHRVKNNLQFISSLLALQAAQIKDRKAADAFTESQNRVRAMALVHEHLYRSGDLASVRLARHVEAICAHLYRSSSVGPERITLDLRVADVSLDLDRSLRCGLIVHELVSNAIKHAFPAGRPGRITVQLDALLDGWYALSVADTGVGLPPGLDPTRSDSLGLQLVADLTEQLGATLTVRGDGGTTFTIRFRTTGPGEAKS